MCRKVRVAQQQNKKDKSVRAHMLGNKSVKMLPQPCAVSKFESTHGQSEYCIDNRAAKNKRAVSLHFSRRPKPLFPTPLIPATSQQPASNQPQTANSLQLANRGNICHEIIITRVHELTWRFMGGGDSVTRCQQFQIAVYP